MSNTAHTSLIANTKVQKQGLSKHTSLASNTTTKFTALNGYLDKKSSKGKWQRRYFEAKDVYLTYRTSITTKKCLAAIDLRTCGEISSSSVGMFTISLDERDFEMKVPQPWTEDILLSKDWVKGLKHRQAVANGETHVDEFVEGDQEKKQKEENNAEDNEMDDNTKQDTNQPNDPSSSDSDGELIHSVDDNKLDNEVNPNVDYHHHHHKAANKIQTMLRKSKQNITKTHSKKHKKHAKEKEKKETKEKQENAQDPLAQQLKHMNTTARIDLRTSDKLKHLPKNMRTESKANMLHDFYESKEAMGKKAKKRSKSIASNKAMLEAKKQFEKHGGKTAVATTSPGGNQSSEQEGGENNVGHTGSVVGIAVTENDIDGVKAKQACCCVIS